MEMSSLNYVNVSEDYVFACKSAFLLSFFVNCFMTRHTHLVPCYLKMHVVGEVPGNSLSFEVFLFSN